MKCLIIAPSEGITNRSTIIEDSKLCVVLNNIINVAAVASLGLALGQNVTMNTMKKSSILRLVHCVI
jgi:hypothetical protein